MRDGLDVCLSVPRKVTIAIPFFLLVFLYEGIYCLTCFDGENIAYDKKTKYTRLFPLVNFCLQFPPYNK